MKRKSLLFLLLFALIAPWAAQAQETLTVYDGTATNGNIPVYGYYADAYNKAEMIMPAADLDDMTNGTISKMTWYLSSPAAEAWNGNFQVYLKEVDNTTFTTFLGVTDATLVWEGPLDGTGSTIELTFANNYTYTGGNLFIAVYQSATGTYESARFAGEAVTNASISDYSYSGLSSITSGTVRSFLPKTTFTYTPGTSTGCAKPRQLAVNYTGGLTATATWTGEASGYDVELNGQVIATNVTGTSYPISGLQLATTYTVRVRGNCGGDDVSDWTSPQSFTTDLCLAEDMCEITYELADSYGDGWNGNTLSVVDVATEAVLATWTIPSGGSSASGSLALCDGREIQFVWAGTSWPYENSFTVYDINGEIICQHIKDDVGPAVGILSNYTVSCTVSTCRKPTDLATTAVFGRSAILNWTENGEATAWVVAYGVDGVEFRELNANAKPFTLENLEPETPYYVKVRPVCDVDDKWSDVITFTTEVACAAPANVTVSDITATSATVSWTGEASSYNLRYRELTAEDFATITFAPEDVWQDGTGYQLLLDADATAYGTIIPTSGGLTSSGNASAATYAEFEYKIPANADGAMNTQNVLIGESATIQVPAGTFDWCVTNPTPGDRIWIAGEGRANDYVFEGGKTYLFVVQSNGDGGDEVVVTVTEPGSAKDVVWTEINNVTSPYTISVNPEKDYIVEVQANCGADGTSAWVSTNFSTPSNCQVPTPLDVTDITASTATLNWTGLQDSYQVQYRTKGSRELLFSESFDSQPSTWTLTNAAYERTSSQTTDYFVYLGYNSTETAYLITPDLTDIVSVGTVEFYHRCYNGDATFQVGFSSTTNDVDAFTWGEEVSAAGVFFTAYDVAMPAGTKYVAVKSTTSATDNYVFINDFGIYGNEIPAGQWNTATANTTSCPISGLTANTEYEWQVRGVNESCGGYTEWCDLVTFTTEVSCPVPTNVTVSDVTGESAVIAWTSDASLFDIDVNGVVTNDVTNPYTLENLDPATIYSVKVRANCGDGDYSDWTESIAFVTDCGGAKDVPYTYGFEDLGEYYACWSIYAEDGNDNNLGIVTYEDAYEGTHAFIFSSYTNYGTDYDQYLFSPELNVEGEATLEFYYRTPNGYGTGETFEVGYYDGSEYTWSDEISTTTTEWTLYTDVLPAGTQYVVIHYYSDYQYYLLVDGFSITAAPAAGQTIELHEGWNWVSTYIDLEDVDGMTMLKEALGDKAISIATQNDIADYDDEDGEWYGLEDYELTNAEMVMILVENDCTITLAGPTVDPNTVEITIKPNGWTWIGYPITTETDIETALADFEAEDEDTFADKNGVSDYSEGDGWIGDVTTLVPGHGYMYYSNSDEPNTLVFSTGETGEEKARSSVKPIKFVKPMMVKKANSEAKCKSNKVNDSIIPFKK